MARRNETQDDTVLEVDELTPAEQENEDTEAAIRAEFDADDSDIVWTVKMYSITGGKFDKEEYLFSCEPSDFPIVDRLRDTYGTGRYRARIYKNNRLYRRMDYSVRSLPTDRITPVAQNGELVALVEAMNSQNAMMREMMLKIVDRPPPSQSAAIDPIGMFSALAGIFVQMQNITQRPATPTESPIEYMKLGIELANKAGGGGETSMLDIFKAALEGPLGQALATQAQERERALRSSSAVVAPQINQPPIQQPNFAVQPPQQTNNPLQPFVQHIESLIVAAEQRKDPEVFAEFLLETLPQSIWESLVTNNQILDGLCQRIPRMNAQRQWFERMIDAMRRMVEDDGEAQEDAREPAGH